MSTRFDVTLPNDLVIKVGGQPLCTDEKFKKLYPELYETLQTKITADTPNDVLENQAFLICQIFNPGLDKSNFLIDVYTWRLIVRIWHGGMTDADIKKKETSGQ